MTSDLAKSQWLLWVARPISARLIPGTLPARRLKSPSSRARRVIPKACQRDSSASEISRISHGRIKSSVPISQLTCARPASSATVRNPSRTSSPSHSSGSSAISVGSTHPRGTCTTRARTRGPNSPSKPGRRSSNRRSSCTVSMGSDRRTDNRLTTLRCPSRAEPAVEDPRLPPLDPAGAAGAACRLLFTSRPRPVPVAARVRWSCKFVTAGSSRISSGLKILQAASRSARRHHPCDPPIERCAQLREPVKTVACSPRPFE